MNAYFGTGVETVNVCELSKLALRQQHPEKNLLEILHQNFTSNNNNLGFVKNSIFI